MKATVCRKYINDKRLILLKQCCVNKLTYFIKTALPCVHFFGKTTNNTIKVYLFYNVRHNTEPSQACQAMLTHSGPKIIFDELKLAEAFFC